MAKSKQPKSLVNTSSLSPEDKKKFKALLDTMAQRFGGRPDSYMLLLGYTNYPNMFSLKSSKEMVDNPDQILLEVEFYKQWVKEKPAFRKNNPFREWLQANPIYQQFLVAQKQALKHEEETGHSHMEDFIANIGTSDAAIHPPEDMAIQELPVLNSVGTTKTDSINITVPAIPRKSNDKIQDTLNTLSEALEEELLVLRSSYDYHQQARDKHEQQARDIQSRMNQIESLRNTIDSAWPEFSGNK